MERRLGRWLMAVFVVLAIASCGNNWRRMCQQDCQRRHDQCLLPASTREAIYACDGQASSCSASCR